MIPLPVEDHRAVNHRMAAALEALAKQYEREGHLGFAASVRSKAKVIGARLEYALIVRENTPKKRRGRKPL